MNLFESQEKKNLDSALPLAARIRPKTLEEFAGQKHFLADGKLLRRMLQADRLGSLIFYGPPGSGKTTLARIISSETECRFANLNAAAAGVKELREILEQARSELATGGKKTILFIDELHRFSKSQQDVLLPDVESGVITLIGATTSNPFFALVSPLVSRSQIFEFKALEKEDIIQLLNRALTDEKRGLGKHNIKATDEAFDFLSDICDGDARRALTALEIGVLSISGTDQEFDLDIAQESIQKKAIQYDRDGDNHYDAASALIKSIRGSDPDAAIYWLARMLEAGEDPRFLARRIVISASEDIGNADPHGIVVANAAAQATEFVGLPECRIILSQAVTYLATAPKSNAAITAIDSALSDVRNHRIIPVPVHLKDAHYSGAKKMGHGKGYRYPHREENGFNDQDYLGVEKHYYDPVDRGYEATIKKRLDHWREQRKNSKQENQDL